MRENLTTAERGYGLAHRKERQRVAKGVERGEAVCARCGRWIAPGSPWHLDHADYDRTQYLGPSHASCNVGARNKFHGRKARRRKERERAW